MSGCGPALQSKVIYAAVTHPSFALGSEALAELAETHISAKQVERIAKGIGGERCDERDKAAAAYLALPLVERKDAPQGVAAPDLAVVGSDGGRIQIFDRQAEKTSAGERVDEAAPTEGPVEDDERKRRGRHWREDKIGLLMAMKSQVSSADPCPEVPEGFLDPTRMGKLVRELRKGVALAEEPAGQAADPDADREPLQQKGQTWKPPQVQHKRLVASRQPWQQFGALLAAAAWAMGLFAASRRAFIGDGAENNWTLWKERFSSFEPVLDFIHALSYVYAAAHAGRGRSQGWLCYARWIRWVWGGQVAEVLRELETRQGELGTPTEQDAETSPRAVVGKALTYLRNNAGRMQYDKYRRQGLPLTSSYVESAVKQFNQRVKGTEKFWSEEGAEAMLQLRADYLSDDKPLEAFWQRRQERQTGQRPYHCAA